MSLSDMIAGSSVAAVLSNPRLPDNPLVECNEAFVRLTGYERSEILGRNCRFMCGPTTEPAAVDALRDAVRLRQAALVEITNYRKDGTSFRNAVLVAPIFDADGAVEFFLGSQMEVDATGAQEHADRASQARSKLEKLSRRQKMVLSHLARGRLNKQIAFDLEISERTVKMHKSAMLRALGVLTTAEAIRLAVEAES